MELDEPIKSLLKDLGMALHDAMTNDPKVKALTDEIKSKRYDIYLIIEANIALDKREDESEGELFYGAPQSADGEINIELTRFDQSFLSSLKIKPDKR